MANYIGNAPVSGEFKHLDSIASQFNGSTTTFSLLFNGVSQSVGDASQLIVSLNGVVQEPLTAYTLGTGGSTAIFSSAPASGSTCFIVKLGGVGGTATPSDNSVTTAKIAPGAVTSAKLDTNIAVSGTTNIGSYVGSVVNSPLDIKADTSHFGLSIEENNGTETWQLGVDVDGDLNFHNSGSATPSVTFDDSGNLLLGKTASGTGTVGVELNPDGTLVGTRSGGTPLFLNRTSSDGKIITLRKDGNEIGYFGSNTTAGQTILDISSEADANSNIRFLTYGSSSQRERLRIDSTGDINFISSVSGLINLNFTDASLNDYARIEGGKTGSGIGELRFSTYSGGLSEAMRIKSNGNVGIGTTSPNTTLTLSDGTDEFDFGVTANLLMIKSVTSDGSDDHRIIIDAGNGGLTSTRGAYIALSGNEASTNPGQAIYQMGNVTDSSHVFRRAGGHDAVIINSSGNVGIGTTTPDAPLTLINSVTDAYTPSSFNNKPSITIKSQDGTNNYSGIRFTNTTGGYEFMFGSVQTATSNDYADMVLQGYDWGATTYKEHLRVKNNGNVGIGTDSPADKMHIYNSSGTTVYRADVNANSTVGFEINKTGSTTQSWKIADGITHNGALQFYDATNSAVRMHIDGSGNVGFGGTTSPSAPIDVVTSSVTYAAEFTQSNTSNGDGVFISVGSTAAADYALTVRSDAGNTSVLAAKADGKVGIGVFSPFADLTVGTSTAFDNGDNYISAVFQPAIIGGESAGMLFGHYPASGYAKQGIFWERYVGSSGSGGRGKLHFVNRDATDTSVPTIADTRMTIDEVGSVLVGKTSTNSDTVGVEALPAGQVYITANNTLPFYINRKGTSGNNEFARFSDDGATRGTIASSFQEELTISASGTNSSGILFSQSNQVRPMKNGSTSSGTQDLGAGNGRWKDIYLSGGIDFGNATSTDTGGESNLLDDYETGTWTPKLKDLNGNEASAYQSGYPKGTYVKIGSHVWVNFSIRITNKGSMTGNYVFVANLPFNKDSTSEGRGTGTIDYYSGLAVTKSYLALDTSSTVNVFWLVGGTNATGSHYVTPAHLNNSCMFKGGGNYRAT